MDEFEILINALRIIASPYVVQKNYYPKYVSLGDEIANELECLDFVKEKLMEKKKLSAEILIKILEIDEQFLSISFGEINYSSKLWEDCAVEKDVFWENQRNRAINVLKELGVQYKAPI